MLAVAREREGGRREEEGQRVHRRVVLVQSCMQCFRILLWEGLVYSELSSSIAYQLETGRHCSDEIESFYWDSNHTRIIKKMLRDLNQ